MLDFVKNRHWPYQIVDLWRGDRLPHNLSLLRAVIVMGGPMNVYEEDRHPFLKAENDFIKKIIMRNIPYLGICLGAQLLAKAAGGRVRKGRQEELGWYQVDQSKAARGDLVFRDLPKKFEVFQWHGDTFSIPPKGVLLVKGRPIKHQAFRVGKSAYGLQFHVEVDDKKLASWFARSSKKANYIRKYSQIKERYIKTAKHLYKNFFEQI